MDTTAKNLHLGDEYSDLTIICGDTEFKAHKLVVCSQSAYFQRAFYGSFKEAYEPIRFPDKEPELMEKFLEYLYTGDYTLEKEVPGNDTEGRSAVGGTNPGHHLEPSSSNDMESIQPSSTPSEPVVQVDRSSFISYGTLIQQDMSASSIPMSQEGENNPRTSESSVTSVLNNPPYFHARMYAEGDYFLVEKLKTRAQEYFAPAFQRSLEKQNLRKEALEQTVEEVYSNRTRYDELRSLTGPLIVKMLRVFSAEHKPFLRDVMRSTPDFKFDLGMAFLDNEPLLSSRSMTKTRNQSDRPYQMEGLVSLLIGWFQLTGTRPSETRGSESTRCHAGSSSDEDSV
ncbi:hypothetical protein PMG11_01586 [Penicillium brasilianum]|uniref:BTB domain-containing protein n=1 Tax=Penicillium brasilianum TaxID=104259 RepID=A0A0F7THE6_PENBI|nr:hypothetical protein PMG11_01586 [Penicillium brasilianum]